MRVGPARPLTIVDQASATARPHRVGADRFGHGHGRALTLLDALAALPQAAQREVQGLIARLERHHPDTAAHVRRVGALAMRIAQRQGLPRSEVLAAGLAGLLHDAGKLAVPVQLLDHPGALDRHHRREMERHAQETRRLVAGIDLGGPMADVARLAGMHHEKLDGSGYPEGLAAKDIPRAARAVTAADIFDALTQKRAYKPALPRERALAIMQAEAPARLDAEVLAVLAALDS